METRIITSVTASISLEGKSSEEIRQDTSPLHVSPTLSPRSNVQNEA